VGEVEAAELQKLEPAEAFSLGVAFLVFQVFDVDHSLKKQSSERSNVMGLLDANCDFCSIIKSILIFLISHCASCGVEEISEQQKKS
jgi:hypothetical protein